MHDICILQCLMYSRDVFVGTPMYAEVLIISFLSHCVGVSKGTAGFYRSYHRVILVFQLSPSSGVSYRLDVKFNIVNND